MSVDSLIELKNLIEDYPYCQTAQILYLLNLKRLGEDTFDVRLPHTAICVNNRERLKCAVEKVDEILAKESGKTMLEKSEKERRLEPFNHAQDKLHEETVAEQISRSARNNNEEIKTFRSKTISELLNLQVSKPTTVTKIKLPKPQTADDLLLEQLRQEALAKVNERLIEIRKTEMIDVNFSETPKRMTAAQDLIDKVIATNPKISKVDDSEIKQKSLSHWKAKEERSLREDYEMVSETLARLYIAQGAHAKAREIYNTLSRKFPEKADYFTQLSKQIKINHKPKTKK
jgi:tetratricopeptide (TPR) repeat protein